MPAEVKDRYLALVKLIERTGAASYRIEHTDPANGVVMWIAISEHQAQRPRGESGAKRVPSAGAGQTPLVATYELASRLVDGGTCAHCARTSGIESLDTPLAVELRGFTDHQSGAVVDLCWYRYDPELKTYRRSCEGDVR
jgi:hypothetical protein